MCWSNGYLQFKGEANGRIEADYQLFSAKVKPAGECRLYFSVDVTSKPDPSQPLLPFRIAPAVLGVDGKLEHGPQPTDEYGVALGGRGRKASVAAEASTKVKPAVGGCKVVVYAAPPFKRLKCPPVVKDQKVEVFFFFFFFRYIHLFHVMGCGVVMGGGSGVDRCEARRAQ
jgi:hypothetical protein